MTRTTDHPVAVYLMSRGPREHKIGISVQPWMRRLQVDKGATLVSHKFLPRAAAMAAERIAHKELASSALGGEWFAVTEEDAIKVLDNATDRALRGEIPQGARVGKAMVAGQFHKAAVKQLRMIAVNRETTIQQQVGRALNLLFREEGLAALAQIEREDELT